MSRNNKNKDKVAEVDVEYSLNELVFCKIRGSRPWPSRVIRIEDNKVMVEFLADNRRM